MRADFLARIGLVVALCQYTTFALPLLRGEGEVNALNVSSQVDRRI